MQPFLLMDFWYAMVRHVLRYNGGVEEYKREIALVEATTKMEEKKNKESEGKDIK